MSNVERIVGSPEDIEKIADEIRQDRASGRPGPVEYTPNYEEALDSLVGNFNDLAKRYHSLQKDYADYQAKVERAFKADTDVVPIPKVEYDNMRNDILRLNSEVEELTETVMELEDELTDAVRKECRYDELLIELVKLCVDELKYLDSVKGSKHD